MTDSPVRPVRMAYLLSQYPAVNHVFMLREVRSLRNLGLEIRVASIRQPDRDATAMTVAEREEAQTTYYVKGSDLFRVAATHIRTLISRPVSYCRGVLCALKTGPGGLFYFAEAVVLGQWMRTNRLTHLHTHFVSSVGWIVARTFPITLSVTFHGPAEFEDPAGNRLAEKVRASLFTCAISRYGAGQLMYACPFADWPKIEVTFLGVDPDEFPPRPFRLDPLPFQIVTVGRLAPVKGQHLLLAAMEILVKEGRQVRLRLAGDGPDRPDLEQDARARGLSGHVSFEGNVNQDRLREIYRESDALVLASFAEGLPVVLMEAMAMEIPCVSPWVNGIPEIIAHETDGLLVPPGDASELACAIGRLMSDPALRRSLGERARRKVLEKFNLRRNTEHLAEVFRRRL